MKLFSVISFIIITLSIAHSQSIINESKDIVFAASLNELYIHDEDSNINKLDFALSKQFNIKYTIVTNDPYLKQNLIDELLNEIKDKGYKIPKKIKVKNYFEPYEFILELPIYFNKHGNIIENNKKKPT